MEMLMNALYVGAGGALGAVLRYLAGLAPLRSRGGFPVITLAINVLGALLIGVLAGLAERAAGPGPRAMLFWRVGLCGGFTTFSTFSLETLGLLQNGSYLAAGAYVALSASACVAAAALGQTLTG